MAKVKSIGLHWCNAQVAGKKNPAGNHQVHAGEYYFSEYALLLLLLQLLCRRIRFFNIDSGQQS